MLCKKAGQITQVPRLVSLTRLYLAQVAEGGIEGFLTTPCIYSDRESYKSLTLEDKSCLVTGSF